MNRKLLSSLAIFLAVGGFVVYVVAQQTTPSGGDSKLTQAGALIEAQQPEAARELLAMIPVEDPEYLPAKFYDALALDLANEQLRFLNAVAKLPGDTTGVPGPVLAELDARHIRALLFYRKFDELLPKARVFAQLHPDSPHQAQVNECLLAALFDHGMKKTEEACRSKSEEIFAKRWPEGKASLEEFLALAAGYSHPNYLALPRRNLATDIWVARLTLGGENVVLAEVPATDAATREKVSLLRVQLYQKLQREKLEQNISLISDFLREFPESKHRRRLEFDLATLNFRQGERLAKQAEVDEKAGNSTQAEASRNQARKYFEVQRTLHTTEPDKESGIERSDILDMQADLLYSYFLEKNYAEVSDRAGEMVANGSPGDIPWIIGMVYHGIVMLHESPPKAERAIEVLEAVMALDFKDKPEHDYYILLATKWRIYVARITDDHAKARELTLWVQDSNCRKNLKTTFLDAYRVLLNAGPTSTR
jgi:hypothetical protein